MTWILKVWAILSVLTGVALAEPTVNNTGDYTGKLPSLACSFDFSVDVYGNQPRRHTKQWHLWRESSQVETREAKGRAGEIWQQDADGEIFYWQVFHKNQQVIEYTPDDLQALQRDPHWPEVASLIDPLFLKNYLRQTGAGKKLGRPVQRYQGRVDGIEFDVWWSEADQIAMLVRQVHPDRVVTVRINEIHALSESPWARNDINQYLHRSFADLRDQERRTLAGVLDNSEPLANSDYERTPFSPPSLEEGESMSWSWSEETAWTDGSVAMERFSPFRKNIVRHDAVP